MQLILRCKYQAGSVSFPAQSVDGVAASARQYEIVDGLVTLAGEDAIVQHDVDELLAQGIYRMLTPQEQEQLAKQQAQSSQLQESAPDVPPAVDKKKAG